MKNIPHFITRLGFTAVVAGALCVANTASAQSKAAEPPDDAPPVAKTSMAPVGAKPSKAELEKQKADQGEQEDTTTTSTTAGTSKAKGAAAGNTGQLNDSDRQFLMMAAKDGMKEVHMGQMAVQQGQSDEVKKLGNRIAQDHTKANQQLMAIAAKKGIKPDTSHKMAKMSKRDMANFDQAWLGMMINDHQKDIALFERQAQNGSDPDLRNFAKKTVPVLKKHLQMVQAAQKKMGSTATAPNTQTRSSR
jgi:putative membrane protein